MTGIPASNLAWWARGLYDAGLSVPQVAERLHCSRGRADQLLESTGLELTRGRHSLRLVQSDR